MPEEPTVGITGAAGYLGGVARRRFQRDGWKTVALIRRPVGPDERAFELGVEPAPESLTGLDVLIHCAFDLRITEREAIWRINVGGTRALLQAAQAQGVGRVIVVSSMSAYDGTQQLYGSAKLAIEEEAFARGAVVVRPGLVWGPDAGGMVGTLRRLARLPLIPLPAASSFQFTLHQDDWAEAMVLLATTDEPPAVPLGLANESPVSIAEVLRRLAPPGGRPPRVVPVNWHLAHGALRALERTPLQLPVRSDSVLGLAKPAPSVPNAGLLVALGLRPRPYSEQQT